MTIDLNTIMAARLARRDVPRDEKTVRIVVDSRVDKWAVCGRVLDAGSQTIELYESDVAELKRWVETDLEGLRLAEEDFRAHLDEVEASGGVRTERPYRPSLEASFRAMRRRDMLPLRSVTVLGEDKPQPTKK
jgi:hypothetical protein